MIFVRYGLPLRPFLTNCSELQRLKERLYRRIFPSTRYTNKSPFKHIHNISVLLLHSSLLVKYDVIFTLSNHLLLSEIKTRKCRTARRTDFPKSGRCAFSRQSEIDINYLEKLRLSLVSIVPNSEPSYFKKYFIRYFIFRYIPDVSKILVRK